MSSCVFLHLAILTEPGWLFPPSISFYANYHHEPTSSYILDTQTEEWCQSFCLPLSKMEGDVKIDTNLIYVSSVEVLRKVLSGYLCQSSNLTLNKMLTIKKHTLKNK